ncbi:nucleoside deaminase [Geminicoccaceae bacterium 1502E]|nr:nucleoside deaminase [Geminicoccaceae bacterium 1502E]
MIPHETWLEMAVELALQSVREAGGRPFGAVIVKNGALVATGVNELHRTGDPTTHAELQAIREACVRLDTPRLDGCTVYASGHPCPMCLAAMHLCGVDACFYAYSNAEGEPYGLGTAPIYEQLAKPLAEQSLYIRHIPVRPAGEDLYEVWTRRTRP